MVIAEERISNLVQHASLECNKYKHNLLMTIMQISMILLI